ncbi:hypothetical protein O181_015241 [Austropuccinia psidii MF-1]|uniref:Mitochondrial import receptor subunit tom22 n=1 Tax=Austropuccinia psidii MF-1 TaxID=1389203 RepID=A0A9Q3GPX4_9BASI|nr:hypothetical protein [Austropuccinia psidii MF-1]
MVKIEELKLEDSDDGFVTESDTSSQSGHSEADQIESQYSDKDEDEQFEEVFKSHRIEDETIADRIYALRDIVNPSTRTAICESWNSLHKKSSATLKTFGNVAWVITTSLILVGLPMALSIEGESMLVAHEKEVERQQQGQQNPTTTNDATTPDRTASVPKGF